MIDELFRKTNVLEVVSADSDPNTQATKLVVRVLHDKAWIRMMTDLLLAASGEDEFGIEVHKIFYVNEEPREVRFAWVVFYWGDETAAVAKLEGIVTRKVATPPPFALGKAGARAAAGPAGPHKQPQVAAASASPAAAAVAMDDDEGPDLPDMVARARNDSGIHSIEARARANGEMEFTIPLPHIKRARYTEKDDPNDTVSLSTPKSKFKARVLSVGEHDYAYRRGGNL